MDFDNQPIVSISFGNLDIKNIHWGSHLLWEKPEVDPKNLLTGTKDFSDTSVNKLLYK